MMVLLLHEQTFMVGTSDYGIPSTISSYILRCSSDTITIFPLKNSIHRFHSKITFEGYICRFHSMISFDASIRFKFPSSAT
mmetsp:Transcript_20298/g.21732  ORF Transcript_20298/g.21732 Transcript_20298/m.21732 type:complete len:81 (-) Transcript_20298:32-274(-)